MEEMKVRFSQMHIAIRFMEQAAVPYDKDSAIRGGMGQCLLQQNCIQDRNCGQCSFQPECIVQKIMYSKYQIVPDYVTKESMGYVLSCLDKRTEVNAGDEITFTLTLFGYTILYLSQIINAIHALGLQGLGKDHARFEIAWIRSRQGRPILTGQRVYMKNYKTEMLEDYVRHRLDTETGICRLRLVSPFCSKYNGQFIQELNSDTVQGVLNAIVRKVHMLMLYEGVPPEPYHFEEGDYTYLGGRSHPVSIRRYSSSTDSKMNLYGITGYFDIRVASRDLMKCILAGELIQVGKNTRFGFGVYRLERLEGE